MNPSMMTQILTAYTYQDNRPVVSLALTKAKQLQAGKKNAFRQD